MYYSGVRDDNRAQQGIANKWYVGSYRHQQPIVRNVYYAVRSMLKLSQKQVAIAFGVSFHQWNYRERTKRMYHVAELLALKELSGLDDQQFIKLLNDVA